MDQTTIDLSGTTLYLDGSSEDIELLAEYLAESMSAGEVVTSDLTDPNRFQKKQLIQTYKNVNARNIWQILKGNKHE